MNERGGGKEREAPTHLIKNSKLTHVACVTKISKFNGGSLLMNYS